MNENAIASSGTHLRIRMRKKQDFFIVDFSSKITASGRTTESGKLFKLLNKKTQNDKQCVWLTAETAPWKSVTVILVT